MNFSKLFTICFIAFAFFACTEEDDTIHIKPHTAVTEEKDVTLSTDFSVNSFESNQEEELLKEIKICDVKAPNDIDEARPACSPKFFRFFKLNKNEELKNGFILLVKAGVNGFPLRRVLIFQRENGILIKLNGFNGNLIERRKSPKGYDDLIIRFADNYLGNLIYYNCLFTWENGKYEYVNCEVIDEDGPRNIIASKKDSMGIEIKKILDENNMIF